MICGQTPLQPLSCQHHWHPATFDDLVPQEVYSLDNGLRCVWWQDRGFKVLCGSGIEIIEPLAGLSKAGYSDSVFVFVVAVVENFSMHSLYRSKVVHITSA